MSNIILLILLIAVSYFIFLIESKTTMFGYANLIAFGNNDLFNLFQELTKPKKDFSLNLNREKSQLNEFRINPNQNSSAKTIKQPLHLDKTITAAKRELKSNLKHLELILALETPLSNLVSKDKCTVERLEEFVKIKKEVQIKIIELSQTITAYQSSQVNMC
ncbi:hypothetical protein NA63_0425 [Flavobacteriaceae bacterium MAR_2010_105]|nr:hypothetical protein NA63_0425 [Flavobacteriaceae bacterium MAR_2010_105]